MNELLARLDAASRRQRAAYRPIAWPAALDHAAWGMAPDLVSVAGTAQWEALDPARQRRLSHAELANFFSLNIHGERRLIDGLAACLHDDMDPWLRRYLLHFIEEEALHTSWFRGWCERYGEVFPERVLAVAAPDPDPVTAMLVFFARVLVFETLVDGYNQALARDPRVEPLAREINRRHHADESRHLAFGRAQLAMLAARYRRTHAAPAVAAVREGLERYLASIWRDLANPGQYARAGLLDPIAWHRLALQRLALREPAVRARLRVLIDNHLLEEKCPA